jgi:surface protein
MSKININLNGSKNEELTRLDDDSFSILSYKKQIPKIKHEYQVITLKYDNNKNNGIIRLFSNKFFIKNRNKFILSINNKKFKPSVIMKTEGISSPIRVKMIIKEPLIDMNHMFLNCSFLKYFKSTNNNMTNMKYMFAKCTSLEGVTIDNLDDKVDDSLLKNEKMDYLINQNYLENKKKLRFYFYDLSHMFYNCKSLKSLSFNNFDSKDVENMSSLFEECTSLKSIPNISNWNTEKVKDMSGMFSCCKSLENLPDISKWNTSNIKDMSLVFNECFSLKSMPDISKWNIENVINIL